MNPKISPAHIQSPLNTQQLLLLNLASPGTFTFTCKVLPVVTTRGATEPLHCTPVLCTGVQLAYWHNWFYVDRVSIVNRAQNYVLEYPVNSVNLYL